MVRHSEQFFHLRNTLARRSSVRRQRGEVLPVGGAGQALCALLIFALVSIPAWAANVEAPGIPNFHQLNEHVYRGGQPTDKGWASLARLGVNTVVDLRVEGEHSISAERRAVETSGMRYVSLPMSRIAAPSDEQVSRALAVLASGERVFVHCRRGKDRTGTLIACYRISFDRWQNQKALDEATSLGMSWIESGMRRYILNFRVPRSGP
jgi:protein tyrosine phosphatase (PTP) superfamily phosphohydrolase (DUF442 family)